MIKTCDGRKHPVFTEQFSQHGFKVQIACVNLEILRVAPKGESVSVFAWMLLLECGAPHHVTLLSSSPASAPSPSSLPPPFHLWESSGAKLCRSLHVLMSLERPQVPRGPDPLFLAHSSVARTAYLLCLTIADTFPPQDLCTGCSF